MVKLLVALSLGLVAASSPAATAQPTKPADKPSTQDPQQKYCLKLERTTGSNVDRSGCRTKDEWRKLGINIDDLLKD